MMIQRWRSPWSVAEPDGLGGEVLLVSGSSELERLSRPMFKFISPVVAAFSASSRVTMSKSRERGDHPPLFLITS